MRVALGNKETEAFSREVHCTYRDESYRVRDNGAVFRLPQGSRRRPLDEVWTFGIAGQADGYMSIAGHKVHRIVATAFCGEQPSTSHVVDHIDTNRRNNRASNLRWVTRLENILLNPITARRIELVYGSIEEFLADPRNPKGGRLATEFQWMRTVTKEEAEYSLNRLMTWANAEARTPTAKLGDWIFGREALTLPEEKGGLTPSKTPGALQRKWKVPAEFPWCPQNSEDRSIEAYYQQLEEGEIAVITPYNKSRITRKAIYEGAILLLCQFEEENPVKPWSLLRITLEGGLFVHESKGTYFQQVGAEKEFTLAQGLSWEGGETFDDLVS